MSIKYNKDIIPDCPPTPAGEMNRMSLAMLKKSIEEFSDPIYKDQLQAIRQGLESANKAFNEIRLKEVSPNINTDKHE